MRRRRSLMVVSLMAFALFPLATLAMTALSSTEEMALPAETATAIGAGGTATATATATETTTTAVTTTTTSTTTVTTTTSGEPACRWLCVADQCRLDVPEGVTCGDDTEVVDVDADPVSDLCEPVPDDEATYLRFADDGSPPVITTADGTPILGTCDPWTTEDGEGTLVCSDEEEAEDIVYAAAKLHYAAAMVAADGGAGDGGDGGKPKKKEVLITTFCEFTGVPDNPTKRIRERLEKAVRDKCGADIDLSSVCLKVEKDAIKTCKVKDRIVISLGVCPGDDVRIETEAQNCFEDFDKKPPTKGCVVDGGKPTVCGPKPPDGLIPCKVGGHPVKGGGSGTAGTYVCNATYYWACTQSGCVPYFIHIPNIDKSEDEAFIGDMADVICKIIKANK